MKCPSCGANIVAGETICLECGTDVVVTNVAMPEKTPAAPTPTAHRTKLETVPCPDCGESVSPDSNSLCPVCGHDFNEVVTINEEEFFREPPSLDEALEAERKILQSRFDAPAAGSGSLGPVPVRHSPPANWQQRAAKSETTASAEIPLPGDRHRARYSTDESNSPVSEAPTLTVEGGQSVFFDGKMTSRVRLDVDQLLIGRRDPSAGHYPEIDLAHFQTMDRHLSRRHARVFRRGSQWLVEDLCENDATFVNDRAHVLNREEHPLEDGDRIFISDSIALLFSLRG